MGSDIEILVDSHKWHLTLKLYISRHLDTCYSISLYIEELLDRITPTKEVKKGSKSTFIDEWRYRESNIAPISCDGNLPSDCISSDLS